MLMRGGRTLVSRGLLKLKASRGWLLPRRGLLRLSTILSWSGVALAVACYLPAAAQHPSGTSQQPSSAVSPPVSPQRLALNRYCVTCHNEKLKTANLMLDKADVDSPSESAEVWEKVVKKLRS